MRIFLFITLILLLATGCPSKQTVAGDAGARGLVNEQTDMASTAQAEPKNIVIVCSATESDQWSRELLTLAGAALGFDPWATPGSSEHLDLYGPYETTWKDIPLKVTIAFVGFTTVAELLPQQTLGSEARTWLEQQDADVLWLDGDPAQLHIGALLENAPPILFSGVVNDKTLYYDVDDPVCGVYQRHSLSGVVGMLWQLDPPRFQDTSKPLAYALITDDSPVSQSRASRYARLEMALPDGQTWIATPKAQSWQELKDVVDDMQTRADALIFCGVGGEGCSKEFLDEIPPADLLADNTLPAVVLGPSRIDQCGAAVLSIKPSAAVSEALDRLGKILAGRAAASLGVVEPEDMKLYLAESSSSSDRQTVADDEAPQP